jgi:PAS domain S-box-containing protein
MNVPLRVLIVDDSEEDTLLMVRELRRNGYDPAFERVDTAEAMNTALNSQEWDIIVADYMMPRFSGLAALKLVKDRGIGLPFIMVSGKIGEDIAVEAMKLGCSDYVMKDKLFRLEIAVERALREAEIHRARKEAEDALAVEKERLITILHSKENLDKVLNSMGDGVITTEAGGRIILMNKMAEVITEWTQDEAQGHPIEEVCNIVDGKACEPGSNPLEKVLKKIDRPIELASSAILISKGKKKKNIAANITPLRDKQDTIIGIVAVIRDITEKERVEEELRKIQKIESLGILAGGIAHDFNNILVSIIGGLSLLKLYTKSEDKSFEMLTMVEKSAFLAGSLARQLLTFSKGGDPVKKVCSIEKPVKDAVNFSLRGSKAKCTFSIADELWLVEIDEGQISQVLNNLIINADQAMPKGGVIQVSAENVSIGQRDSLPLKEGRYVKVCVKDEGTGILREHLSRIFDPYFTTKSMGSGLGLAISYSIIKRHGGYITVESEVGVGTTFSLYLPASQKDVKKETLKRKIYFNTGKVLLLEDEDTVRTVAGQMLTYLGYEVEFAEEGIKAIELYKKAKDSKRPFDVVIMDITIPGGVGGEEAVWKLREIDPEVKAIVSSGYSNSPVMTEYEWFGFNEVIAKPYEIHDLGEKIYRVMKGRIRRFQRAAKGLSEKS